jgi:hypothetical protein
MSDPTITLTFPRERCGVSIIGGKSFVHVDTGLTVEEFVRMILQFASSDDRSAAVIKHD